MIDEVPILAVLAARAEGVSRISGAGELRVKESDRLAALATNLRRIGVRVEEFDDGLEIEGTDAPLTGVVESFHDHRIAMAFGILGATSGCDIRIDDAGITDVSFPGFWDLLARVRTWWGSVGDGARRPGSGTRRRGLPTQDARTPTGAGSAGCTVVAIDGSAGSGKSTTAAAVADQLGYRHLDSGALYRTVTLGLLDANPAMTAGTVTPADLEALDIAIDWHDRAMAVRMRGARVPEKALRAARVTSEVSAVSALAVVREHLLELQRAAADGPGLVAEGRDMGTVVFPHAAVKIYLDAHPQERARRRIRQRGGIEGAAEIAEEARRLKDRDDRDSSRSLAPLVRAGDAVLLGQAQDLLGVVAAGGPQVAGSGAHGRHRAGVQARHVEQGAARQGGAAGVDGLAREAQELASADHVRAVQVGGEVAVGLDGPPRPAGRARREEDGGRVVDVHRAVGKGSTGIGVDQAVDRCRRVRIQVHGDHRHTRIVVEAL